jgi:hypothetical protein
MCCCTRQDPTCTLGVACPHVAKPLRAVLCDLHGRHFAGGSVADWNDFARGMERENEGVLQLPV